MPEKVGLKAVQRDGVDYEFTLVFDIDIKHNATASKDRTGLFIDKPEFQIGAATGRKVLQWCTGEDSLSKLEASIQDCNNMAELSALYQQNKEIARQLEPKFIARKKELQTITNIQNFNSNGTSNN